MSAIRTLFGKDGTILRDYDFQALLLANITAPLGTALLSPILDSLTVPFAVSTTRIGLLMSAFTAPSIVFIPILGIVSDRIGRKPILVGGLLLFGASGTAIAFTTNFELVLLLRLVQGLGAAGIVPITITSIGDLYEGSVETTAQGLRYTTSGLTQTVFPLVAGGLVVIGWQYPIFMFSIALFVAPVVAIGFEESNPDRSSNRRETAEAGPWKVVQTIKRRRIAALLLAYGMPGALYIGFLTYVSILVVRLLGSSPALAGFLVAVTNLMKAASASQAGRLEMVTKNRLHSLVAGNLTMGGGLLSVALAPSIEIAVGGSAILGLGTGLLFAQYRSLLSKVGPEPIRGGIISIGESGIRIAMTVVPVLMAAVIPVIQSKVGFGTAVRVTLLGLTVIGIGLSIGSLLLSRPHRPY